MHAENENFLLSARQERHRLYGMSSVHSDELCFCSPKHIRKKISMSDYTHLDFTTWSSKAELVGDVAEVLSRLNCWSSIPVRHSSGRAMFFAMASITRTAPSLSQMMTASGGAFCGLVIGCRLTIYLMLLLMSGSHASRNVLDES